jgi:hypothetical protein
VDVGGRANFRDKILTLIWSGPVAKESVVDSALLRSNFRPFKTTFLYTSCTQKTLAEFRLVFSRPGRVKAEAAALRLSENRACQTDSFI